MLVFKPEKSLYSSLPVQATLLCTPTREKGGQYRELHNNLYLVVMRPEGVEERRGVRRRMGHKLDQSWLLLIAQSRSFSSLFAFSLSVRA